MAHTRSQCSPAGTGRSGGHGQAGNTGRTLLAGSRARLQDTSTCKPILQTKLNQNPHAVALFFFFLLHQGRPLESPAMASNPAWSSWVRRRGFPPLCHAAGLIPQRINRPLKLHRSPPLALGKTPAMPGPAGPPACGAFGSNLISCVYYSGGKKHICHALTLAWEQSYFRHCQALLTLIHAHL